MSTPEDLLLAASRFKSASEAYDEAKVNWIRLSRDAAFEINAAAKKRDQAHGELEAAEEALRLAAGGKPAEYLGERVK